jgi:hypothetical protein
MPGIQELVGTGSVDGMIRRCAAGFYSLTRSFCWTVSLMAALSERPREFLILFPWLVLEHCLRVGIDAVIEFGWVSLKGTQQCVPHIWVVTDDGILDPVMLSSIITDPPEALDIVYHEEVPPGYEPIDGEILTIARFAYEQGLEDYISEIRCPPDIRAMAFALCALSHRIAPLGAITL